VIIGDGDGKRAPLVGRVSMDLLTVDVSACDARIGDVVTLWGGALSVDEAATWAGTIAYELMCKISERVARVFTERAPLEHAAA